MRFFQKQIHYETLNEKLRRAREEQFITLDTAEKFTDVSQKYLLAIENGDYHLLPGEVYAENFIKRYAIFLGFDTEPVLHEYRRERRITKNSSIQKKERDCYRALRGVCRRDFLSIPKILRLTLGSITLFVFFLYLGFRIHSSLRSPMLTLFQPQKDMMVEELSIKILGKTEKGAEVWINDRLIFTDPGGYFEEEVELTPGVNSLVVFAKKKHSQVSTVERKILVTSGEEIPIPLSLRALRF